MESVEELVVMMKEPRPLPMGMTDFHAWSDRIIDGACIPMDLKDPEMTEATHRNSMKYALAVMIMHLSPTQDHECDGYFMKSLRKSAINQVADSFMKDYHAKRKSELKAKEALTQGEVTAATKSGVTHEDQVL